MANIIWTNERRKLSQLKPWERNPRQIKNKQAERLAESFDTFGQVEIIVIDPNNEILNGHQRLSVLARKYDMDYEVDVRVSSRPLTEKEREKLTIFLHRGATGEWDFEKLLDWDISELMEWGFDDVSEIVEAEEKAAFGDEENEDPDKNKRLTGDKHRQIRPVLYAEQITDFENAILKTGLRNRGEAIIEICKFYLKNAKPAERQLDFTV